MYAQGHSNPIVEAMAAGMPTVELVELRNGHNVSRSGQVAVDLVGIPLTLAGEQQLSRMLAQGCLAMDVRAHLVDGLPTPNVLIERGFCELVLTRERLIVVFSSAVTVEWGHVEADGTGDGPPAVVATAWPLLDVGLVRSSGAGERVACGIYGQRPAAVLMLTSVPAEFADAVVMATAAAYRRAGRGGTRQLAALERGVRRVRGSMTDAVFDMPSLRG